MRVCYVKVENCNGPTTYRDAKSVLAELEPLIESSLDGYEDDTITITFGAMDEAEFDALPEFEGYGFSEPNGTYQPNRRGPGCEPGPLR